MKSKKVKVSIVIPCYNAEKYIKKCLDSIFAQTFKNFELICVNDGSTDSTLDILNEYAKKNSCMTVITKKNEGGKNTTKFGVSLANGEYICAIDNDDYVAPDYLQKLYTAITKNNSDIAICGFQREDYVTRKIYSKEMNKYNKTVNLSDNYGIILEINTSLWNKLFKKEIFKSIVDYDLTALAMGDMTLMAYMYANIEKVTFISDILYYYQVREGSNISNISVYTVDSIYDNLIRIKKDRYLSSKPEMIEIIDAYAFLHLGVSTMYRIYQSNNNYKKMFRRNCEVLNEYFSSWKTNKYYRLSYVIKNKGENLKLSICNLFYKIHMFKLFLAVYNFVTTKLKFEIKW